MSQTDLSHSKAKSTRLLSLDVFRGLTIALMILVNSPGNQTAYACLEHSLWNGCTLADLVFPFFIFIVGVSSVFSLSKARENGVTCNQLSLKIIKRSLLIFSIGLLLNAFPHHFDFETLRIFGVLQRIALCYFFASLLFITTRAQTQVLITLTLLIGYWFLLTRFSALNYGEENNIAAIIDRHLFSSSHLYGKTFDPEGLLSTIPAIATALIGNLTGIWLRAHRSLQQKLTGLRVAGLLALAAGGIWGLWFPINKTLWTSSYVLWTAGFALLILAGCYWAIEIKKYKKGFKWLEIFGVNALAAYILHVFFLKIQAMIIINLPNNSSVNLRLFITDTLFGWASADNASLLYAVSYTLLWLGVMTILYRKKIFIKL